MFTAFLKRRLPVRFRLGTPTGSSISRQAQRYGLAVRIGAGLVTALGACSPTPPDASPVDLAASDQASPADLGGTPDASQPPQDASLAVDLSKVDATPPTFSLSHYGDSITSGSEYNPQTQIFQFDGGGFRAPEERAYAALGWHVTELGTHLGGPPDTMNENDGYPGYWIGNQGCNMPSCYAQIVPTLPCGDEIELELGTNDLRQGAGVALMTTRITGLLDEVHAHCPASRILVLTVPSPAGAVTDTYNKQILPAAVAARPYTALCDSAQDLVQPTDFAPDHIHPLTQGYAKIAAAVVACRKTLEGR